MMRLNIMGMNNSMDALTYKMCIIILHTRHAAVKYTTLTSRKPMIIPVCIKCVLHTRRVVVTLTSCKPVTSCIKCVLHT